MGSSSFLKIELALGIPSQSLHLNGALRLLAVGWLTMLHGMIGTLLPPGGEKRVIRLRYENGG